MEYFKGFLDHLPERFKGDFVEMPATRKYVEPRGYDATAIQNLTTETRALKFNNDGEFSIVVKWLSQFRREHKRVCNVCVICYIVIFYVIIIIHFMNEL